jgi:hypothetical protein
MDPDYYHPRRTLDQFYHSHMEDTSKRDKDQVVSRQTNGKNIVGGPTLAIVDQLWLYLFVVEPANPWSDPERGQYSSAVLSAFPASDYVESPDNSEGIFSRIDIRQTVMDTLQLPPVRTHRGIEAAATILSTALVAMLSKGRSEWSLDFCGLFQEAIADVVNDHDAFFSKFNHVLRNKAARIEIEDRRKAVGLGLTIADIIDELAMLRQLFEMQLQVLDTALSDDSELHQVECLAPLRDEMRVLRRKIQAGYLVQISTMTTHCERIHKSLMNLLDLQQREESIREAHSANQQALFAAKEALAAREGADATEAQSQIVFIFAVVTIIFLPLSFFPTFFGLYDVVDKQKLHWSEVQSIVHGVSWPIIGVLLAGTVAWYFWHKHKAEEERLRDLIKLEDDEDLPDRLITPKSPLREKMDNMRKKIAREEEAKGQKFGQTPDGAVDHGDPLPPRSNTGHANAATGAASGLARRATNTSGGSVGRRGAKQPLGDEEKAPE